MASKSENVDITGAESIDPSLYNIPVVPGEEKTKVIDEYENYFNPYGYGGEFEDLQASSDDMLEAVWDTNNITEMGDV